MEKDLMEDLLEKARVLFDITREDGVTYFRCLDLAAKLQQNEILRRGLVVCDGVPSGLEAVAMALGHTAG